MNWYFGTNNFAKVDAKITYKHSLIKHKSFLLRPLKDVEMYLQHNKVTNLRIAIKHINKVVIKPKQTFSIWQLVGRPTKLKGYLEGMTLHNGQISKDTGGGLCQLGNLLYWMVLHTPLTIKERWRHSYDVFPDINRTIPFACGATLSYNYIDLQLENNTDQTFQINLWLDDEYLNGEITCDTDLKMNYEIYETDHLFKQQWWGGYTRHNKIWKRITNLDNSQIAEELVTENNAIMMYSPLLENSAST
ncbi:MAG TPA: VanW family protein [Crocinitomicaceae bacterium]|nr:VanW family protein [Crocinitomicaceae bacterium]